MRGEYRGRFFLRQRIWRCGDYMEVETYPVFQRPGVRRAKCRPTREAQRRLNQRDAELRFLRTARLNFTDGDYEIDMTFARAAEEAEARQALRVYLRKLRMIYRAAESELKYMYTLERGKKSGRTHFHMILNRGPLSRDELEELWPHGWRNARRLDFDETGLCGLSTYIAKQGKARKPEEMGKRRWSCSKNLIRPQPEICDAAVAMPELERLVDAIDRRMADEDVRQDYPGWELVDAEAVRNAVNRGMYVRLSICRLERWRGRRPVARYSVADIGDEW